MSHCQAKSVLVNEMSVDIRSVSYTQYIVNCYLACAVSC